MYYVAHLSGMKDFLCEVDICRVDACKVSTSKVNTSKEDIALG